MLIEISLERLVLSLRQPRRDPMAPAPFLCNKSPISVCEWIDGCPETQIPQFNSVRSWFFRARWGAIWSSDLRGFPLPLGCLRLDHKAFMDALHSRETPIAIGQLWPDPLGSLRDVSLARPDLKAGMRGPHRERQETAEMGDGPGWWSARR